MINSVFGSVPQLSVIAYSPAIRIIPFSRIIVFRYQCPGNIPAWVTSPGRHLQTALGNTAFFINLLIDPVTWLFSPRVLGEERLFPVRKRAFPGNRCQLRFEAGKVAGTPLSLPRKYLNIQFRKRSGFNKSHEQPRHLYPKTLFPITCPFHFLLSSLNDPRLHSRLRFSSTKEVCSRAKSKCLHTRMTGWCPRRTLFEWHHPRAAGNRVGVHKQGQTWGKIKAGQPSMEVVRSQNY